MTNLTHATILDDCIIPAHTTILDGCIIPAHITLEDCAVIDEIPVYLLGSEDGLFIATENDDLILV